MQNRDRVWSLMIGWCALYVTAIAVLSSRYSPVPPDLVTVFGYGISAGFGWIMCACVAILEKLSEMRARDDLMQRHLERGGIVELPLFDDPEDPMTVGRQISILAQYPHDLVLKTTPSWAQLIILGRASPIYAEKTDDLDAEKPTWPVK